MLAESAARWKCVKDEMMATVFVVKMRIQNSCTFSRVGKVLNTPVDGLVSPPKALQRQPLCEGVCWPES